MSVSDEKNADHIISTEERTKGNGHSLDDEVFEVNGVKIGVTNGVTNGVKRGAVGCNGDSAVGHMGRVFESKSVEVTSKDRRVVMMKCTRQIKEIHTIIWDKETPRQDFIFYADRLIRMVIEEGLNQLPFTEYTVKTHTGVDYKGCSFYKGICGVSIVRSGEAMEKGLRECCRSIRIGKIILKKDDESDERSIIYARFPPDIHKRKVLLMYPILLSGGNVTIGVDALMENGVKEEDVYVLTLFATPKSLDMLFTKHPNVLLLTTEISEQVPIHFGDQYFGTQ